MVMTATDNLSGILQLGITYYQIYKQEWVKKS